MSRKFLMILAGSVLAAGLGAVSFAADGDKHAFHIQRFDQIRFAGSVSWSQEVLGNGCTAYTHDGLSSQIFLTPTGTTTANKFSLIGTGVTGAHPDKLVICGDIAHVPTRQASGSDSDGTKTR